MARSKKPPIGDPETGAIAANEVPAETPVQEPTPIRGTRKPRQARTVPVTGYDAKGEAADYLVEMPAAADKGQEQKPLPGIPAPKELWPRFDGYRVTKVALAFSGVCDLTQDAELAKQIAMGGRVTVVVTGEFVGRAFKFNPTKSGEARTLMGTATLGVTDVHDLQAPKRAKARVEGVFEEMPAVVSEPDKRPCHRDGCGDIQADHSAHGTGACMATKPDGTVCRCDYFDPGPVAPGEPESSQEPEPEPEPAPTSFDELLCVLCGHTPHSDVCDEPECGCSDYVPEPATFAEYLAQMRAAAGNDERTTPCARCGDMKVAHYGKCRSTKDGGSTCSCPGFAPDAEGF